MADNVGYTPGSGATIASDDIGGVQFQRMKFTVGADGVNDGDVSSGNPLPAVTQRSDDLAVMLARLLKVLESNAVVDQQQRQRITLDAISTGLTLNAVGNVATVGTITNVAAQTTMAGMDREMYINVARQAYALAIRPQLQFA
jgi:predicted transcriptional regulator